VVHSFAGDDPLRCRDHVRASLGIIPSEPTRSSGSSPLNVAAVAAADNRQQTRIAAALRIWNESEEAHGTLVERYLKSRSLKFSAELGETIRYHPQLSFEGRRLPAMVALLRDIHNNTPCGVHRTWLDTDGRKVARRMLGRAKAAAVKLDSNDAVTHALTIGEGIETSLAARQLDCRPVWALGSAIAIQAFPLVAGIETLCILAENDESGANARAVEAAAERWLAGEREVFIFAPRRGDINDALMRV